MTKKSKPLNNQNNPATVLFAGGKKKYRDALFDSIVNSEFFCYAALRVDYSEENLFCGQVGEIQRVMIDDTHKDSYYLIFTDYQNNEKQFAYCFVKKEHLFPLFYLDPNKDKEIKTTVEENENRDTITLKQIRDNWEKFDVSDILNSSTSQLLRHNKVSTRFQVGQLVTIQINFEQKVSDNETFIIQAGQIGIISRSDDLKDDNDAVEVIFCSIPFGELVREKEELVSLFSSSDSDSFAKNFWKKKIHIDKDFLFPLYFEKLEYCEN